MHVNVVAVSKQHGGVMRRLAEALLVSNPDWTLSTEPDKHADINYFIPYLIFQETRTKKAARFTHYDTQRKEKADMWNRVASAVDIRITTAPVYLDALSKHGPSALVTPPIEPIFFEAVSNENRHGLGVAGYVYGDGRKGEHLIERLVNDGIEIRGSGKGWACKTTNYAFKDLPSFFAGLDILIVPSLFEGIPMPPLEAMATGCRLIIPRGVGLLDTLPNHPAIFRYECGDYDSLHDVVQRALKTKATEKDRQELIAIAKEYTSERWGKETHDAIKKHVYPAPKAMVTHDQLPKSKCGIYYVAFGEPARRCAHIAIPSAKRHLPNVEIAFVSDEPLNAGEDHYIYQQDTDIGGRRAKLSVDMLAPKHWEYVLYLDIDTEIVGDISFLFQALVDGWEFLICKDASKYATVDQMMRPDNKEEVKETWDITTKRAMQWNGGVFAYRRNERTAAFFELWLAEWDRYGKRDQAAMLRAMWKNPLKTYLLGNEWNTVTRYYDIARTAGILHRPMTARRWTGIIWHRLDAKEAFDKVTKS